MADAARKQALNPATRITGEAISILPAGPRQLTSIRAIGEGLDAILPTKPLTGRTTDDATILWLGPDEWLIDGDPTNILQNLEASLKASTDVSHRTLRISLEGANAALVLNAACPLDLHNNAMREGNTARSHFGKTAITLHRTGPQNYELYTNRSFAEYTWTLLEEAAREFKEG